MKKHSRKVKEQSEDPLSDEQSEDNREGSVHLHEDDGNTEVFNAGWADSVSKILKSNKPKRKKDLVLSRAKKFTDVLNKKSKPVGFDILGDDGEVQKEAVEEKVETPRKKKRLESSNVRVKPNVLERGRERTLQKIATKGVVQLFNAVRMQQKDISKKLKEAGPLEVRKEKALKNIDKRAFLDVLMGEKSENVERQMVESKTEKNQKRKVQESTWSVLKENFMMGAKMKDWDKELETVEVEEEIIESE